MPVVQPASESTTEPDASGFHFAALLPLAAALIASLRDIITWRISRSESSLAILTFSILGMILASLATVPFGWREVSVNEIVIAGGSGLLFGIAHYLMIEGYRLAEASLVAPFRYTRASGALIESVEIPILEAL